MEIIRAKTAGFCFGVDRAVKLTYDLLAEGRKVATLGPLWSASPATSNSAPILSASIAILWIFATNGQVAS